MLAGLVALNLASLARLARRRAPSQRELFTALLIDVAALTLQFYLTGGATNPFTFLYLLQVTLGAVLLDAWSDLDHGRADGACCFAGLTSSTVRWTCRRWPAERCSTCTSAACWSASLLDAALLVLFVTRINRNLRERDARLAALRQRAAEEDHIVRLGLLASGAAHELGTPLATLSVILGDWRRMPALTADPELVDEIAAMEAEVRRCKAILTGILVSAGEARGESAARHDAAHLPGRPRRGLARRARGHHAAYDNAVADDLPIVSDTALKQVVFNVLDNAFEASPRRADRRCRARARCWCSPSATTARASRPEILEQIGKPYVSSKGGPAAVWACFSSSTWCASSAAASRSATAGAGVRPSPCRFRSRRLAIGAGALRAD